MEFRLKDVRKGRVFAAALTASMLLTACGGSGGGDAGAVPPAGIYSVSYSENFGTHTTTGIAVVYQGAAFIFDDPLDPGTLYSETQKMRISYGGVTAEMYGYQTNPVGGPAYYDPDIFSDSFYGPHQKDWTHQSAGFRLTWRAEVGDPGGETRWYDGVLDDTRTAAAYSLAEISGQWSFPYSVQSIDPVQGSLVIDLDGSAGTVTGGDGYYAFSGQIVQSDPAKNLYYLTVTVTDKGAGGDPTVAGAYEGLMFYMDVGTSAASGTPVLVIFNDDWLFDSEGGSYLGPLP